MKKIILIIATTFFAGTIFSQASETVVNSNTGGRVMSKDKQLFLINSRNKNEDKTDLLDITGISGTVYSSMSYPDGSTVSTGYSSKIILSLLTGINKTGGYQLVFLPDGERVPAAVDSQNGISSIYFHINAFQSLSQKLEQSIAAKKKVQIKLTQNPNGYREGILVF